jgi:C-terminal processing protease CtpA/Prc
VGRKTAGAVQFGSVSNLALPNSRMIIAIPTSYIVYKDRRDTERHGYSPEILVKQEEDPMNVALADLKKNIKK